MAKIAFLALLTLALAAPSASALAVPSLVDTCLTSPLATCVDSVSPRVKASRLLPAALVPDPAPAAEPAAPAEAMEAEEGATPVASAWQPDEDTLRDAALVALAALALVLFVLLVRGRARRGAKATTLASAMRAGAMQKDIDRAWRDARRAPSPGATQDQAPARERRDTDGWA